MKFNGGRLLRTLVPSAHAWRSRVSRRKTGGKFADDHRFRHLLAARVANAGHEARDLNRAVGNSLLSRLSNLCIISLRAPPLSGTTGHGLMTTPPQMKLMCVGQCACSEHENVGVCFYYFSLYLLPSRVEGAHHWGGHRSRLPQRGAAGVNGLAVSEGCCSWR